MKKKNIFFGIFLLCIVVVLIAPLQGRATIDPRGIYLDEEGNPRDRKISALEWRFLQIQIDMIMNFPAFYPGIEMEYDQTGQHGESMKEYVNLGTQRKIVIHIRDAREILASARTKSKLLEYLMGIRYLIDMGLTGITDNFDFDVIIYVIPREGLTEGGLLAYFYLGEFVILKDFS